MKLIFHAPGITEIQSGAILIRSGQDSLDLIMNADIQEPKKIIFQKHHFSPGFFDLKGGLAGDVLQKFVNYQTQVAVVGDFSDTSEHFQSLIRENNRGNTIFFVENIETGIQCLTDR